MLIREKYMAMGFMLMSGVAFGFPLAQREITPPRSVSATRPPSRNHKVQDLRPRVDALFAEFDRPASPGAAVVVIQDGRLLLTRAYGQANLEYGIPIASTTPFHIGSVSKQFTAYAVLLLEQDGRLSLDDDVRKHIREMPDFGTPITLRHLLHHQSGLRELEQLLWIVGITSADTLNTSQLLRLFTRQTQLNFKPGEQFEYCNTGYALLAEVIARSTGKSFRAWTTERLFRPLGMEHTWFADSPNELIKQAAYPYLDEEGGTFSKGLLNHAMVGETGIITTAEDMALWLRHLTVPRPEHASVVERMLHESGTLNSGEKTPLGFGLGLTEHRGLKVAVASGMDAGFRASVTIFPEKKLGIAILGNVLSLKTLVKPYQIADIVLGLKLEPTGPRKPTKVEATGTSSILDLMTLRSYAGRYFSEELETQYTVVEEDGKLLMKHWRNEDAILIPRTKDAFTSGQWWMGTLTFIRDGRGAIAGFQVDSGRVRNLVFKKR